MKSDDLVERLLAQNDRLIEALAGNSPVEIIRALNPPMVSAPQIPLDTFASDPEPVQPDDPWGDEDVPLELLRGPASTWRGGWVAAPGSEAEPEPETPMPSGYYKPMSEGVDVWPPEPEEAVGG